MRSFHHPDLSLPVIRRDVTEEILQMIAGLGEVLVTRGRSLTWNHSFPSRHAYNAAVSRLRKKGLIATHRGGGKSPIITLTAAGRARLPAVCRRATLWKKRWDGLWYILVYDVPESDRPYRETLRAFLRQMRMGCLQRSVWVTPRDIRPEYDDLREAAAIDDYAFLFESRTVLGRNARDVVHTAWNMDRLARVQAWYCEVYAGNLERVERDNLSAQVLTTLAREELSAYLAAMEEDPLLPVDLWPPDYRGRQVVDMHKRISKAIALRL